jgi:3-isopropylmalate/(R)-2-methylmalate dehydratase large subunit
LQLGVSAKDRFLHLAGTWGHHPIGMSNSAAQPGLSIDAQRRIATIGAEFATLEPDDRLIAYVREHNDAPFEPQYPDPDAGYAERREVDLDRIRPLVALPDRVIRNSVPVA